MAVAVITGSSGLVGSEVVAHLDERGWTIQGIDNSILELAVGPDR